MLSNAAFFTRHVRRAIKTEGSEGPEAVPPHWLTFMGRSGTGKTHLAKMLWNHLHPMFDTHRLGWVIDWIYWPEFVEQMRENIRKGGTLSRFLSLREWPILFLDDIGAERDSTGFAGEKLNMLLAMRTRKWTILTSNLSLQGLSLIDERIASRIVREPGNLFLEIDTVDYGLRSKNAP